VHTAELRFQYERPNTARIVADAIEQEIGEIGGDRALTTLSRGESQLSIEISAEDLVALRAGLNTWETLVEVAERSIEAGGHVPPESDP
jgi:KEOPS complex subunit Pcc1